MSNISGSISRDGDDIPDDFFDDLNDNEFLDELADTGIGDNDNDSDEKRSSSPLMERYQNEIDKLTKDIQRRKKKLEELSVKELESENRSKVSKSRQSRSNSINRSRLRLKSPIRRRSLKERSRSIDRRHSRPYRANRTPLSGTSRRSNTKSKNRSRTRSHSRGRICRRSRSSLRKRHISSPLRIRSHPKNITYLEELAQKLAEKGQEFPEKNLLMQIKNDTKNTSSMSYIASEPHMQPVIYPPESMPLFPPYPGLSPIPDPVYGYSNYVINPIAVSQETIVPLLLNPGPEPMPVPMTSNNLASVRPAENSFTSGGSGLQTATNKTKVLERCHEAIKQLRAVENKVPKLRFTYTPTSITTTTNEDNNSPLNSLNNVLFKSTSLDGNMATSLRYISGKSKNVVKALGYNCAHIISKFRMEEMANRVILEIEGSQNMEKKNLQKPKLPNSDTQKKSSDFKCAECVARKSKIFFNKSVQIDKIGITTVRTQTDEEDYQQPLIMSLNKMSAAQLIAIGDFAKLICESRPTSDIEMCKQVMDIYKLSKTNADAVKEAEIKKKLEQRAEDDIKNFYDNSGPSNQLIDTNIRMGQAQHVDIMQPAHMDIIPNQNRPPGPNGIPMDYNRRMMTAEEEEFHLQRAEEKERERELRLQQIRYEQDVRLFEMEEEQRLVESSRSSRFVGEVPPERARHQQQLQQQHQQHNNAWYFRGNGRYGRY